VAGDRAHDPVLGARHAPGREGPRRHVPLHAAERRQAPARAAAPGTPRAPRGAAAAGRGGPRRISFHARCTSASTSAETSETDNKVKMLDVFPTEHSSLIF